MVLIIAIATSRIWFFWISQLPVTYTMLSWIFLFLAFVTIQNYLILHKDAKNSAKSMPWMMSCIHVLVTNLEEQLHVVELNSYIIFAWTNQTTRIWLCTIYMKYNSSSTEDLKPKITYIQYLYKNTYSSFSCVSPSENRPSRSHYDVPVELIRCHYM